MKLWPEDWFPPYVVAWRLLWFLPMQVFRLGFVAVVFVSLGGVDAHRAWDDTR